MINLSRHIEALLLNNDCVIVPGFGGFVTQYVPAAFVVEENLYLPPYRGVSFNAMLTLNDGLLVESYMKAQACNYAVAMRHIEMGVAALKREIENAGSVLLPGIGELVKGEGGLLNFVPVDGGVATPKLYALDACYFTPAVKMTKRKPKKVEKTESDIILSFNRNMVNAAAAAVIGALFYFIWAPVMPKGDMAHASMMNVPIAVAKPVKQVPNMENTVVAVPQQKTFVIAVETKIKESRAERMVESLKRHGFDDARMLKSPDLSVVVGQFATESEAQEYLKHHADDSRHMKHAKVMAL